VLKLIILLLSYSKWGFFIYVTELLVSIFALFTPLAVELLKEGETGSLFATGIFGKSFTAIFGTFCSFVYYSDSYFQLFLFLEGDGLVNLVFLSALNLFSPL
jgi:hypothetical protein